MADLIQKRFSTIETILKMLNHRELMFRAIETSDKRQVDFPAFTRQSVDFQSTPFQS